MPITIDLYVAPMPPLGAVDAADASTASYVLTTAVAFAFLRRVADYREALAQLRAYSGRRRRPAR